MAIPFVYADEFGYLGNAATLSGHDWSGVGGGFAYYGFGYSLLIAPIYWVTSDPRTIYDFALLINNLCLAGIFLLAYDSAQRLIGKHRGFDAFLIALAASAYPAFQFYAKFALAEAMLTFLVWLMFYLYVRLERRKIKLRHLSVLALVSVYAYAVHPRALVIIIATLLIVGLMRYRARIRWRDVLSVCVITIALMIAVTMVKNYLIIHTMGKSPSRMSGNVYHVVETHVAGFLSINGIKRFLHTLGGQSFYLISSTYGLWLLGMCIALYCWCRSWVEWKAPKNTKDANSSVSHKVGKYFLALSFVLLSMLGMLFVSSVFMMHSHRIDGFFYGRYNEAFIGPVLLLAFCAWCRSTYKWAIPIAMIIGLLMVTPLGHNTWQFVQADGPKYLYWLNIPSWLPYRLPHALSTLHGHIHFWFLPRCAIYGTLTLALIGMISRRLAILATAIIFCVFAIWNINQYAFPGKHTWDSTIALAQQYRSEINGKVLYFLLPKNASPAYAVNQWVWQFQLPDTRVLTVQSLNMLSQNKVWYAIVPQSLNSSDGMLLSDAEILGKPGHKMLLVTSRQHTGNINGGNNSTSPATGKDENKLQKPLASINVSAHKAIHVSALWQRTIMQLYQYPMYRWLDKLVPHVPVELINRSKVPLNQKLQLQVYITKGDQASSMDQYRVTIPGRLTPGKPLRLSIPIIATDDDKHPLGPGNYTFHFVLIGSNGRLSRSVNASVHIN
jgi:hypothetical protein